MNRDYPQELLDAGKRVADTYALHKIGLGHDAIGKWFAARLSDGTTDNVLYDSKSDAVRHQHHDELFYCFVQVGPWTMTERDAAAYLAAMRQAADKGLSLIDRNHKNGGMDVIKRTSAEDQYAQLRSIFKGDMAPTNIRYPGR